MIRIFKSKTGLILAFTLVLAIVTMTYGRSFLAMASEPKLIKWVDFNASSSFMKKAVQVDIATKDTPYHLRMWESIAFFAAKYGNNFSKVKNSELDVLVGKLKNGEKLEEIAERYTYFDYYLKAYRAVLSEFVGEYIIEVESAEDPAKLVFEHRYGLKAFSPIAYGYSYSHTDDYGNARNFGGKRKHLGNDIFGSIGTPVVAVESGVVEEIGWNYYGGWRIGIRSLDGQRYYYYAHLRKGKPFTPGLKAGHIVAAGEVIGYLGMTGYSNKKDVNNMSVPHLHFGMQIIFDQSQLDGNKEIWIDVYSIVRLLSSNKSRIVKDPVTKYSQRKYGFSEPSITVPLEHPYKKTSEGNK